MLQSKTVKNRQINKATIETTYLKEPSKGLKNPFMILIIIPTLYVLYKNEYFLKHRQTIVIIPNLYVLYKNEYLFFLKKSIDRQTHTQGSRKEKSKNKIKKTICCISKSKKEKMNDAWWVVRRGEAKNHKLNYS